VYTTSGECDQRADDTNHTPQLGTPPALLGGGEMGERIRANDWSTTSLGPIETWPQGLHTAAGIVLGARAAMAIGWGPNLILLYNDAWSALIGDRHPGALGQPARAVFPGTWETVGPLLAGVMSGHGAVDRHDRRLMADRHGGDVEEAWFDYSFSPIPCADGTIGGVFCVAAETTDHARAEIRLRQNEERLRLASTAARIGTYTRDLRTGQDDWSPALLALFGLGPGDALPLQDGIPAAVHPDDRERVLAETVGRRRRPAEPEFTSEHRIILPDGETRWVLVRGQDDFDEQGRPVGVIGVAMDVTERVQAEEALRETERQYRELVRRAPTGIYELDFGKKKLTSVNDAMCRMSGYSREELLAMDPFDLLDAEGQALFQRRIQKWLSGVEPDRNVEFRVKTKDGRAMDALLDVTFTMDADGQPLGAAVVAHDITERKRRERRIGRYNSVLLGINRIFEQVIRTETEEALGETCLDVALEVTGSQVGFVGEVGDDGFLHSIALSDMGWAQCQMVDQGENRRSPGNFVVHGLYGRVVDDGKGFFANDPFSHPDSIGVPPGHLPLTSFLGVPLTHEGETIGMLAVANREGGYSAEQQQDLEALAPAVVEALLRKRAEAELRSERSLLGSVMQATDVMLVLLDPQFNFVWVNPAYAGTCRMQPEEMVGKNHFALYPDEENEAIFRQVRDTGEGVFYRDKPFVFPDQPERGVTYWDWSLAPLKGSGGDVTGLVFSLRETTRYVQAEKALRESKETAQWLARFPEENPNPVLRVSADGVVMYRNPAAATTAGWQCEVGELLPHRVLWRLVGGAIVDGRAVEQDIELGGRRFSVALSPIGEEGYANIYARDITARKQAEEALRRYAERLRFLREVDEAILAARSAEEVAQAGIEGVTHLLPCLRASAVMRDLETGELVVLAVYHRGESKLGAGQRETLGSAESGVLERLARGETVVVDDLQTSSFSAPVVVQLKAEGVRAQVFEPIQIQGQLVGLLVVSMDVPGPVPADQQDVLHDLALQLAVGLEQVRLYEAVQRYAGELEQLVQRRTAALEASESRFRTIFEEAAIGIALTDAEGVLMATNPAMQRMLGCGEDELLGMRIFDFSRSVDEPCSAFPEELLTGQRSEYALEQAYSRRDGEVGQANVTMSLLHRDTEQAPLVLILAEDITDRVQAQEALIRAEKLAVLGRMTTSLAHEINNPIQSVVGCLGLAMEVLEDGEDATRFMEVALEESERAARIVHRLRDLTRSEETLREPSGVRELVETVLVLTQNQAQNRHVALIWEGEDGLAPVPMVRDRIQQVFLNLVLNAIDAMPGGGELRVHATRTEEPAGVQISFVDTGVGIPPEQVERIFEGLHSTKEMGLGLGLHVSRNIVREHGGHIDVESQLGHGTTFTVWLPAA
jgi:PAS domain S-box-containing protein